jgi:hypothetical protein
MRKINIENTKIHFSFTLYGRYYMNDGLLLSNGKNWKEILQTVLDQQHSTLLWQCIIGHTLFFPK